MATKTLQTRHGPMIAFCGDKYITPPLESGEYAPDELALLAQLVRPGMTVVGVGANIGAHTVPLAKACAPGLLYASEPQQRVFQVMCANLVLNEVANVVARPEACGETEGEATIPRLDYDAVENFGGVSLQPTDRGGERVRVVALDQLALARCDLIKIDAEGFEPQVLKGADQTIARCRPIIYAENDRPAQQQEVISMLDAMGYSLHWRTPLLAEPAVFGGVAYASINMLCLPKERDIAVKGEPAIDPANWASPVPVSGAA
ncbi:MAG: FkbM family methyltransferase [Alphaproteobacteria bacterium]|nr:FkbM family methyltransferase [Alphaproteobacteria bacterium]